MKKLIWMLVFTIGFAGICTAQKIDVEKTGVSYKFTQEGKPLKMNDLVKIMYKNDAEAYEVIRNAQSNHTFAGIFNFAGGFLIGWPIGTAIGGGVPNWSLAAIGTVLVLIAIPISSSGSKKAKAAVDIYNTSLESTSYHQKKPEVKLQVGGNVVGISVAF